MMNLNGDNLSDALAAQVGGIGIAPGANINYVTGHAIFDANFERLMPGSTKLKRSEFGDAMIKHMGSASPDRSASDGKSKPAMAGA